MLTSDINNTLAGCTNCRIAADIEHRTEPDAQKRDLPEPNPPNPDGGIENT
jgi:hypothetical protein